VGISPTSRRTISASYRCCVALIDDPSALHRRASTTSFRGRNFRPAASSSDARAPFFLIISVPRGSRESRQGTIDTIRKSRSDQSQEIPLPVNQRRPLSSGSPNCAREEDRGRLPICSTSPNRDGFCRRRAQARRDGGRGLNQLYRSPPLPPNFAAAISCARQGRPADNEPGRSL